MYALRNLRALTRITRAPSPFSQRGTAAAPSRGKKQKARGSGASGAKGEGIGLDVDLSPYREKMQRTIEAFQRDLSSIRSSGASPSMLDNVQVEAYGTMTSLQKLAQVTVRDARSLQVSVFDTAITAVVEKAIRGAGLNLNPALESSDAGRITVPVPKATRETRDLLQKAAAKAAETARVSTRNVRRSAMDAVKKVKSDMSKDAVKRLEKDVQSLTDETVKSIDDALGQKVKTIG